MNYNYMIDNNSIYENDILLDFKNTITHTIPRGIIINESINRSFLSSFLFIIPAIYGYMISYYKIIIGSIICFITSSINHYFSSQHKIFRPIDIISVICIALYFIYNCYSNINFNFYSVSMYIICLITLSWYIFIKFNKHLDKKYYFITHILAVSGIMFYIKAFYNNNYKNDISSNDISSNECV